MGEERWVTGEGRQMSQEAIFGKCFLCEAMKQQGPHRSEGRDEPAWGVWICHDCRSANWDGIAPKGPYGHKLVTRLEARNIPYALNSNGWIDIPD